VLQADIDDGTRDGVSSVEHAEIKKLKAENTRLREDARDSSGGDEFLHGGTRPPKPLMMGFIDTMRSEGHAVESICRVLREQDCQIAARTYRAWKTGAVASRTVTDAQVQGAVRHAAWTTATIAGHQRRKLTPEGLYGRRKMTALIRRTTVPAASRGAIDRAMRALGLTGIRRDKGVRTTIPAKDGIRAGDLLNQDFTAPRRALITPG
jgi:hypothetical protein